MTAPVAVAAADEVVDAAGGKLDVCFYVWMREFEGILDVPRAEPTLRAEIARVENCILKTILMLLMNVCVNIRRLALVSYWPTINVIGK